MGIIASCMTHWVILLGKKSVSEVVLPSMLPNMLGSVDSPDAHPPELPLPPFLKPHWGSLVRCDWALLCC